MKHLHLINHLTKAEIIALKTQLPSRSTVKPHLVVGLSGGVDSSVTACVLHAMRGFEDVAEYDLTGVYMRNWDELEETDSMCQTKSEWKNARLVGDFLDVPVKRVDFVKEYWNSVWNRSLELYEQGLTPNPDVMCNREIKFGAFLDHCVERLGATHVATGHYARRGLVRTGEGGESSSLIARALDRNKDQSYFLAAVEPRAVPRAVFPVGVFASKARVRELARLAGLPSRISERAESMGVCFVGERKGRFGDFLGNYLDHRRGDFVEAGTGRGLGPHAGFLHYTPGARARIAGARVPYFVVEKRVETGEIVVAAGANHPALETRSLRMREMVAYRPPSYYSGRRLRCQVRYRQSSLPCEVHIAGNEGKLAYLDGAVEKVVAPGQIAVLYDAEDECVVGSGMIVAASS